MLAAMDELLALNAHQSKKLGRIHRHFRAAYHEELAVPPARPISKKSRAAHKAADDAAHAKHAGPAAQSRDLGAEQHEHA